MQSQLEPNSGILLINLGTPDSADVADVRRYLGEFLMDPFVLSAPTIIRALDRIRFYTAIPPTRVPRLTPLFGQTRAHPY